jgi:hypothetical protein
VTAGTGFRDLAWILLSVGVLLVVAGAVLLFADRIPWIGRLPGDLVVHKGRWTIVLPIATSILLSILLTIILNIFFRR